MTWQRRLAFGLSGLADNAIGTTIGVHFFVFYTDVVGLSPAWTSAALVLGTAWDALVGVLVARVSDRARFRSGRRRPFLALAAVPLALFLMATFAPRAFDDSGALSRVAGPLAVLTLAALFTARAFVQVPTLALLAESAPSDAERTRWTAAREQLGNVGDLLGLFVPIAACLALGGDDADGASGAARRDGFALGGVLLALVVLVAVLGTWAGTRETDARSTPDDASSFAPFRALLALLRSSPRLVVLVAAAFLGATALAFSQAMILYVLEHVMREHDAAIHGAAFIVNALAAVASYPLWLRVVARVGKAATFRTGLAASALVLAGVFFVGPGQRGLLFVVMGLSGAANVGFWMLLSALVAELASEDASAMGGRSRAALFASAVLLARKAAGAVAAGMLGVGLTWVGYREGAAPSPEVAERLAWLFVVVPGLCASLALLVFRRFERAPTAPRLVVACA